MTLSLLSSGVHSGAWGLHLGSATWGLCSGGGLCLSFLNAGGPLPTVLTFERFLGQIFVVYTDYISYVLLINCAGMFWATKAGITIATFLEDSMCGKYMPLEANKGDPVKTWVITILEDGNYAWVLLRISLKSHLCLEIGLSGTHSKWEAQMLLWPFFEILG